jgi:hypothetical protein
MLTLKQGDIVGFFKPTTNEFITGNVILVDKNNITHIKWSVYKFTLTYAKSEVIHLLEMGYWNIFKSEKELLAFILTL